MRKLSAVLWSAALLGVAAQPAAAQRDEAWQNKWFWGAQSGLFFFKTPTQSWDAAIDIGGHWLITRSRTALMFAIDELIFQGGASSAVGNPTSATGFTEVTFTRGRRVQASLMAVPMSTNIQLMLGGGFAIHQVNNAEPVGPFGSELELTTAFRAIDDQSTKAFAVFTGSAQIWYGRLAIFGNFQYMPSGDDFLITSGQHVIVGGVRIALSSSKEAVASGR